MKPVAWIIPGDDNASANGFLDAKAFQDGEFSCPVVTQADAEAAIQRAVRVALDATRAPEERAGRFTEVMSAAREAAEERAAIRGEGEEQTP